MRTISVFCGSKLGNQSEFSALAESTGICLAQAGIKLVYGGASKGLMGILAQAALKSNGQVLGIIPEYMIPEEGAFEGIKLRITATLAARKAMMIEEADGFIILPGGAGTLEEIFDMIVLGQLGRHKKPAAFIGKSYWAELETLLSKIVDNGFANQDTLNRLSFHNTPQEALDALNRAL